MRKAHQIFEYHRRIGQIDFFHGLLDQGYWPDGIYTPATPESYAEDILAMKAQGFNTLRKHIKLYRLLEEKANTEQFYSALSWHSQE